MKDKFVLDSSVWIAIERRHPDVLARAAPLLAENRVCLVDVIVAEVLRGVKHKKDFNSLRQTFASFTVLTATWNRVAETAFELARHGQHPPLLDVYIACCVRDNHKTLITHDRHFQQIGKFFPISLEWLSAP